MFTQGVTAGSFRLLVLALSFPVGFAAGRLIYYRRSHVEIFLDNKGFQVRKGGRQVAERAWDRYGTVSIFVDHFGRANLRLYESVDEKYIDLPASRAGADPQRLRDQISGVISKRKSVPSILQAVEAS